MKIHFIAIGGSIMHALAINLKSQGHEISGSDDAIYDPARTNLKNAGILPNKEGWFLENINEDLDFIILGMHAKIDNPELKLAKRKKIKILGALNNSLLRCSALGGLLTQLHNAC